MAQVTQRADQTRVAPGRIFRRHPDHKLLHVFAGGRATGSSARRAVILPGDQLAVPAQDRLGRHEAGELLQSAATDDLALGREASPLVIGESQPSPTELLPKYAVLLAEKVDDLQLAVVDPAGHPYDQEPQGLGAHRGAMVVPLMLETGARRPMTTHEDVLHLMRADFRHTTG